MVAVERPAHRKENLMSRTRKIIIVTLTALGLAAAGAAAPAMAATHPAPATHYVG